jgi:hypothetical protein
MRPNYQHTIIANYLQSTYGQRMNWPFCSATEIEEELRRAKVSLSPGEYLVVALSDDGGVLGQVSDIRELTNFPRTSLIIPYHKIERTFHEQHAEWIEL